MWSLCFSGTTRSRVPTVLTGSKISGKHRGLQIPRCVGKASVISASASSLRGPRRSLDRRPPVSVSSQPLSTAVTGERQGSSPHPTSPALARGREQGNRPQSHLTATSEGARQREARAGHGTSPSPIQSERPTQSPGGMWAVSPETRRLPAGPSEDSPRPPGLSYLPFPCHVAQRRKT